MDTTSSVSINSACNQLLTTYEAASNLVAQAIKIPMVLLHMARRLIKAISNMGIIDYDSIFDEINDILTELAPPTGEVDRDLIKAVFDCPILDLFIPASALSEIRAMLMPSSGIPIEDMVNLKASKQLVNSIRETLEKTLDSKVDTIAYGELYKLQYSLMEAYEAPLTMLGMPSYNILDLLSLLKAGETCIRNSCYAVTTVIDQIGKFDEYLEELCLEETAEGFEVNLFEDIPTDIADTIKEQTGIVESQKEQAVSDMNTILDGIGGDPIDTNVTTGGNKLPDSLPPEDNPIKPPEVT